MKRRGFTLIELMVVIAIIIILAAIAIPNYLQMTARAKRSRVASDMATVATVLETYKTDWGIYPVADPAAAIEEDLSLGTDDVALALGGNDGTGALQNIPGKTNAVGEAGGIEYIKPGALTSMTNPFGSTLDGMKYMTTDGSTWVLYMVSNAGGTEWIMRTDNSSAAVTTSVAPTVP